MSLDTSQSNSSSANSSKEKKTPMDIEQLAKKHMEEEQAKLKPVFMSKKQREQLALQEKQKQEEEERQRLLEIEKKNKIWLSGQAEEDKERERRDRDRRDREREREKEKEKKAEAPKETEQEKELIKQQYLGTKKEKKRIVKPSEKFKFVFDWDASEDTSKDINPIYNVKHEVLPQFGRGLVAGIDPKEQLKERKKYLSEQDTASLKDEKDKLTKIRAEEVARNEKENVNKKLSAMEKDETPVTHWTKKTLDEMTERDWRIFREDFNITTKGGSIPKPIRSWREAPLNKFILEAIDKAGYKEPTPIQRQAIPIGLQGRDVMGIAETGSGKTAAFVIPMIEYILRLPKLTAETEIDGPYAVIMAPTRELVQQIEQEARRFANACGLRTIALVGGVSIEEQGFSLRRGCEIVIATPGRLKDCIESRYLVLNQCYYVVLDEADRMIDLGFEVQVNAILDAMPASNLKSEDETEAMKQEGRVGKYRSTTMFSATMPIGVERLARKYLRRPAYVIIGEVGRAVDRIEQRVEWVSEEGKGRKLIQVLQEGPEPPIMIFVNKKKSCDSLAKYVEKTLGYRTATLHSGRNQFQREAAIEGFKSGRYDVLIATDVAGRGIDVKGVTHVINYDMAKTIGDYTHRIGRTGRAGLEGLATTFLTNEDTEVMYDLKQALVATGSFVPQELDRHPDAQYKPGSVPEKKTRKDTVIYAKS